MCLHNILYFDKIFTQHKLEYIIMRSGGRYEGLFNHYQIGCWHYGDILIFRVNNRSSEMIEIIKED